jgi:hypothetical protein
MHAQVRIEESKSPPTTNSIGNNAISTFPVITMTVVSRLPTKKKTSPTRDATLPDHFVLLSNPGGRIRGAGRLGTRIHARLKRHGTSATFALTAPFCVVPTAPSACNHDGLPLSEEPSTLKLHEEARPPTLVRFRAGSSPPMTVSGRIYSFTPE